MATLSSNNKLTLVSSSDKEIFEVEEIVASESAFIKLMIEDLGVSKDNAIPISNVTGEILSKVLLYCKKHVEARKSADSTAADDELKTHDQAPNSAPNSADPTAASKSVADELKAFDAEFINVDQSTLFDLVMAANYLNIKELLDLTSQAIADMIKDKTPEEVRTIFNTENDFTPEEEAEIRRENQWAFE